MSLDRFLGSWRLCSFESRYPDGRVAHPFGNSPIGLVVFSADGYASAHLMRPDRPRFASPDAGPPSPEEARQALIGFVAYYGRCEIDEGARTLTTRVEGSSIPNWIGGDQVRTFEFRGDRLVLRPPARETPVGEVTSELVWERPIRA
jgi:Lipocalin-like domain